jgi:hypothetical protein
MSSEGGTASIEEKRKSPARDTNYKMANGDAPENDLQQITSEGGKIGGAAAALANAQRRRNEGGQSAYTVEHLEGDNMPYARGLGLGDYLLKQAIKQATKQAKRKAKAVLEKAALAGSTRRQQREQQREQPEQREQQQHHQQQQHLQQQQQQQRQQQHQ